MSQLRWWLLLAGLALLRPGPAWCQARYAVQPLAKAGDPLGSDRITGGFTVLGLGNAGQVDFLVQEAKADGTDPRQALVEAAAGRLTSIYQEQDPLGNVQLPFIDRPAADANSGGQVVFTLNGQAAGNPLTTVNAFAEYSAGEVSLIAAEGGPAPGGTWKSLDLDRPRPLKINERGDMLFGGTLTGPAGSQAGVFHWDAATQQVIPVNVSRMRTGDSVSLERTYPGREAINDLGQIVLFATARDATGNPVTGLFLIEPDGSVRPVVLENEVLPIGGKITDIGDARLGNDGVVAFHASRVTSSSFYRARANPGGNGGGVHPPPSVPHWTTTAPGVYRWENGTITPTGIEEGAKAPGRWRFDTVDDWCVSPTDGSILAAVHLTDPNRSAALFRFADGKLTSIVEPGQTMPDGATNAGPPGGHWQLSRPNASGQIAFVTGLADGSTAAYRMDADGRLSLLLKSGTMTGLGTLTRVGSSPSELPLARFQVGLNDQGQVALPVQLAGTNGATEAIVLLTLQ